MKVSCLFIFFLILSTFLGYYIAILTPPAFSIPFTEEKENSIPYTLKDRQKIDYLYNYVIDPSN